jgi:SAM-dependent methyltransferase
VEAGRPAWAPESINLESPSAARVWDFFLGGSHNFAVDRRVGRAAIAMKPDMPQLARRVRVFLRRAVRAIAQAGVTQFLDIGAGIPTVGPVHEIARAVHPGAKVVYVDHDPIAVAHGQLILKDDPGAVFVRGDLRHPKEILHDSRVRGLLDFSRPVGLLLCGVLHFVPDDADPAGIVAALREALAPGSYLALQHATLDAQPPETIEMLGMWNANSPEPMWWRTRPEITGLLRGFEVLQPGVVLLPHWRPDSGEQPEPVPERFGSYAALARTTAAAAR